MLKYLRDKADLAQKLVNRGPTTYNTPNYDMVCAMRERSAGTLEGLNEFSRLLIQRQAELEDTLKQLEQEQGHTT